MQDKIYVRFLVNHVKGYAYVKGECGWVDRQKIAYGLSIGAVEIIEPPQPRPVKIKRGTYETR
jgi:hypothetical protein